MKRIELLLMILILGILIFNSQLAKAEVFVDLYGGWSLGADKDLTFIAPGGKRAEKTDFGNSFTIGYRLGYWFDRARWAGLALEASHFKHDIRQQGIDRGHLRITPISGLLMFRIPLQKTDIYPEGGLLFYGGIGPGMFLSTIKYKVINSVISEIIGEPNISGNYSDRSLDIGLDIRGGIAKMVRERISVFCEYRYTDFKPDFEENVWGNKVKIETEVNTHHVLIGFSYYYN